MNHNHANYEARLQFVRSVLKDNFGLEDATIEPIAYDADSPFKYNNFVYKIVSCGGFHFSDQSSPPKPGCQPIPMGTKQLVLRMSNVDAAGMTKFNRIENEVAVISLVASALSHFEPKVVPSVYAWGSAAKSQGWILQEFMQGSPLDADIDTISIDQRRSIFSQMAEILSAIQRYPLPESIDSFGGLTYDEEGNIVSAPMTTVGAGPWPSYEAYWKGKLDIALVTGDQNPHIKGWRERGVRERLENFIQNGLPAQFLHLSSRDEKCVVHADFTANNLMYDPKTVRIVALIDYDFGCVLHPSYEFLRSFDGNGGQFTGYSGEENADEWALRNAKLQGTFPDPLPESKPNEDVDWAAAKVWEEELSRAKAKRPSTIDGIESVADVDAVLRTMTPWRLTNEDILARQSTEVLARYREKTEAQLIKILDRLGY